MYDVIYPHWSGSVSNAVPVHSITSYDVIATVNALWASYGLPPYDVDNLLMLTAQEQADYLASIAPNVGNGHVGLGGTDADARALAVGYPYIEGLYINENWACIPLGMSIESLKATGWSDDVHMHTVLHKRGQYIGAGVAVSGSTAYPSNRDTRKSTKYYKNFTDYNYPTRDRNQRPVFDRSRGRKPRQ